MMGEAWSDFYANDLLNAEGVLPDTPAPAEVTLGAYVVGAPGIRAKPAGLPGQPRPGSPAATATSATPVLGGYTYGDLAGTDNSSPHNGGEVWARDAVGHPHGARPRPGARARHRRDAAVGRQPVDARHARRDPPAGGRDAQRRRRARRLLRRPVADLRGARDGRQRNDAERELDDPGRGLRQRAERAARRPDDVPRSVPGRRQRRSRSSPASASSSTSRSRASDSSTSPASRGR